MKPFRVGTTRRAIILASLGAIGFVVAERALQAASSAEPLLHATPLVLKDGRIANVSIHVVPFAPGRADLAAEPEAGLAELTRAVGTDCFLTAQVIGHIDAGEVAEDATLNAHRLARSRADAVQAALIGGGLPAKAIASVWDWQFMVRAPRATLWVFQLTAGEDCEGRPLHGDVVAAAPQSTGQEALAEPQGGRAIVSALAPAEPAPARRTADAPVAARVDTAPAPAEPAPARRTADAPVAARVDTAPASAEPALARSAEEPGPARASVPA